MNKKIIKLAEKSLSSKSWEAEDAVKDCLKEIKNGTIKPSKIMIHYFCDSIEDGGQGFFTSGLTVLEHIGLLEIAKLTALEKYGV
jgi:hypothetical protein